MVTFDKLTYVDTLKRGDFTSKQARAQAEAMEQALNGSVATKHDLEILKRDLVIAMGTMILALGGVLIAIKFLAA
jgi:hypothetical protein